MKSLTNYLNEKLIINKDYNDPYTCAPTSWEELRKIIEDRYNKLGPGTKQNPIDFNDVDVSNIDSFCNDNTGKGIFEGTKFKYMDISYWNVSNVKCMKHMFFYCHNLLKSVGDLSNWNVSNVENMNHMFNECEQLKSIGDLSKWNVSNVGSISAMFYNCKQLKSVGDLSNWDVSKIKNTDYMFCGCKQLKSIGDLSNWNVSRVRHMMGMFRGCEQLKSIGDLSNWNVSNVEYMNNMFKDSGIINIPDWYYKK